MLHFIASYFDPSLRSFAFVTSDDDRKLFFGHVLESIHVSSEDTTLDADSGCTESADTNEAEIEYVDKTAPTEKIKTNSFSWFDTSDLTQQSTCGIQCLV